MKIDTPFMLYAFKEMIADYLAPVTMAEFWLGFCAGAFVFIGIMK